MSTSNTRESLEVVKDLVDFIKERKSYWLAPVIFVLLLLGTLFFVLEGTVVAPMIYTIF